MINYNYLSLKRFLLKQICLNKGLGLDIYKEISKHINDNSLLVSYRTAKRIFIDAIYMNDNEIIIEYNDNTINNNFNSIKCKNDNKYHKLLVNYDNSIGYNNECYVIINTIYYNIKKNEIKINKEIIMRSKSTIDSYIMKLF
jgi:hypothetical protein